MKNSMTIYTVESEIDEAGHSSELSVYKWERQEKCRDLAFSGSISGSVSKASCIEPVVQYVSKEELATLLSVSVRTIEKNCHLIAGRVKVGRSIRFYLPDIHRVLLSGQNLFRKKTG